MGRNLAKVIPSASTLTTLYTGPTYCDGIMLSLTVLNPNATLNATIRVALAAAATPTADEYIEKGVIITPNGGVYEKVNFYISPGQLVVIWSDQADTVFRLDGEIQQTRNQGNRR